VLRVYNLLGRRDNLYKSRIKILVQQTGAAAFADLVEDEWQQIRDGYLTLPAEEIERIRTYFAPPAFETLDARQPVFEARRFEDRAFARWVRSNVTAHKQPGYACVTISLKPEGSAPGDASAEQMEVVADLAERLSFDELRVTHEQNL